jgi:hypothetical protein
MPDGATHYKYFMKGYLVEIPLSVILSFWDWQVGLGGLVGYSLHRYMDNDLDLMGVTAAEGRMVKELPVLGNFMFGMSSIYGSFTRHNHRNFWTHFPFISTAIRLFFFFFFPFIILDAYGINFIGNGWIKFWIALWVGLSRADAIHYYLDVKSKWEE